MQLIHANTSGERITGVPKDCFVRINGHGSSLTFVGLFVKHFLTCFEVNVSSEASEGAQFTFPRASFAPRSKAGAVMTLP